MRLREWKYEDGLFSYGQRISVGLIFGGEGSYYSKMKEAWRELYGWSARLMPPRMRARRFARMVEGLSWWVDQEQRELKYTPTAEEEMAGLSRLNSEVGAMGTVNALAEKFGIDPDTVLRWEWAKVYGILRTDLKEHLFSRRLAAQYRKKS